VRTVDGACRADLIWLIGKPECSEKMREMGSAGSIYPAVCRSTGIRLALSVAEVTRAALDVRSIAEDNLVVCVS